MKFNLTFDFWVRCVFTLWSQMLLMLYYLGLVYIKWLAEWKSAFDNIVSCVCLLMKNNENKIFYWKRLPARSGLNSLVVRSQVKSDLLTLWLYLFAWKMYFLREKGRRSGLKKKIWVFKLIIYTSVFINQPCARGKMGRVGRCAEGQAWF